MNLIIGVDIGGTKIKAGLVTSSGKVRKRIVVRTEGEKGRQVLLRNLFRAINKLMNKNVIGIGVGSAGPVDPASGRIMDSPHIPCIKGMGLKSILEKRYRGLLVKVDNDANCFTLGEAIFGAGKRSNYVIGITLGTGVGGGIVVNKELYHGVSSAGEFEFMSINFDGLANDRGNTGAAGEYLAKRALERMGETLNVKTPESLYNLAAKGNFVAKSCFETYGRHLGVLVTNLIHVFDPDCVVIGGNISDAWKFFSSSMFQEIKKRALFNRARIVRRKLGDDAAVLGAASLFMRREISKKQVKSFKRRWGEYKRFCYNEKSTVRIVTVKPGHILRPRSHRNRDELWYAVDGGLQVQIGNRLHTTRQGDVYLIPRGTKHRVVALKSSGRIMEISFGEYDTADVVKYSEKGVEIRK